MEKILIVEPAQALLTELRCALADRYTVVEASEAAEAIDLFNQHQPTVTLLDLELGGEPDPAVVGLSCLESLTRSSPGAKVVVLTGAKGEGHGLRAVRSGAYDFRRKPVEPGELRVTVERALHLRRVEQELARLREALERSTAGIEGIAGQCAALRDAFAAMQRARQLEERGADRGVAGADLAAGAEPIAGEKRIAGAEPIVAKEPVAAAADRPCAEFPGVRADESLPLPSKPDRATPLASEGLTLREVRDNVEKGMISAAVDNCGGNMARTAEVLGISRPALYDLLKKHGLFKPGSRH